MQVKGTEEEIDRDNKKGTTNIQSLVLDIKKGKLENMQVSQHEISS